jgi:hypothetical protein
MVIGISAAACQSRVFCASSVALCSEILRAFPQCGEVLRGCRESGRAGWRLLQRLPDRSRLGAQGEELLVAAQVLGQAAQVLERVVETVVVFPVDGDELAVAHHLVEARAAFHGGDLLEQQLVVARGEHALFDEGLALVGELADLHGRDDHGDQQRQGHQEEAQHHEAAQGSGLAKRHGARF